MSLDVAYLLNVIPKILKSFPTTLYMTVSPMADGLVLGLVMQNIATSKLACLKWLRLLLNGFIVLVRSIPIILQLLILYFVFPRIFSFMNGWNKTTYVIITFSIVVGVSACETFRAAYESIDRGQHEAGISIGYTGFQTWLHIIFPQMIFIALPNLVNLLITMLKDTSLAFSLGVTDMIGYAKILDANAYGMKRTEIYLAVALIYWALTILLEKSTRLIEQYLAKGNRGMGSIIRTQANRRKETA